MALFTAYLLLTIAGNKRAFQYLSAAAISALPWPRSYILCTVWVSITGTVLIVMLVTTIVSYWPSRKIAKLNPTDALRGRMQ
ncbi:MAG: hypothetical protein MZV63_61110 [Marinilabiliales bacterium]|nr:hypothetical protein [Marinilabiliales bacterium]